MKGKERERGIIIREGKALMESSVSCGRKNNQGTYMAGRIITHLLG